MVTPYKALAVCFMAEYNKVKSPYFYIIVRAATGNTLFGTGVLRRDNVKKNRPFVDKKR